MNYVRQIFLVEQQINIKWSFMTRETIIKPKLIRVIRMKKNNNEIRR